MNFIHSPIDGHEKHRRKPQPDPVAWTPTSHGSAETERQPKSESAKAHDVHKLVSIPKCRHSLNLGH